MQQSEFFSIASPCKQICTVNKQGLCTGCLRNRNERLYWLHFSDQEKWEVLQKCSRRQQRYRLAISKKQNKQLVDTQSETIISQQIDFFTQDGKACRQFNQISLFHAVWQPTERRHKQEIPTSSDEEDFGQQQFIF